MTVKKARKKKEKPKGEYRALTLMPGSDKLWQFEVKRKDGTWTLVTNLGAETDADRKIFAQRTAEGWIKR